MKIKPCCVCEGVSVDVGANGNIYKDAVEWSFDSRIWKDENVYYTDKGSASSEINKNFVTQVPIWEYQWHERKKGFFSTQSVKEAVLIKNIYICYRCFIVCAIEEKMVKISDKVSEWDYSNNKTVVKTIAIPEWINIETGYNATWMMLDSQDVNNPSMRSAVAKDYGEDGLTDWYVRRYEEYTGSKDKLDDLLNKIDSNPSHYRSIVQNAAEKELKKYEQWEKEIGTEIKTLKASIKKLLKDKAVKMPPSDIDAFLKHQNLDKIKELCEEMYQDGEISYAGNGRYFVLTEESEKKEEIKTKSEKTSTDPTEEVRKYAKLRDDGIITEEEFQTKKKELLGL